MKFEFIELWTSEWTVSREFLYIPIDYISEVFFSDLQLYQTIPQLHPKDIRLFRQGNEWFAAYLDGTAGSEYGQQLTIKQYKVKYIWHAFEIFACSFFLLNEFRKLIYYYALYIETFENISFFRRWLFVTAKFILVLIHYSTGVDNVLASWSLCFVKEKLQNLKICIASNRTLFLSYYSSLHLENGRLDFFVASSVCIWAWSCNKPLPVLQPQ